MTKRESVLNKPSDVESLFTKVLGTERFLGTVEPFDRIVFFATGSVGRTLDEVAGDIAESVKEKTGVKKLTAEEWYNIRFAVLVSLTILVLEELGKVLPSGHYVMYTPLGWME